MFRVNVYVNLGVFLRELVWFIYCFTGIVGDILGGYLVFIIIYFYWIFLYDS